MPARSVPGSRGAGGILARGLAWPSWTFLSLVTEAAGNGGQGPIRAQPLLPPCPHLEDPLQSLLPALKLGSLSTF